MTEIAIVTSRKARLEQRKKEGDKRASFALTLAENPTDLLSTIQIGITLIGIITGAFGGAAIANQISVYVAKIDFLAPISSELSLFGVVAITTYLSLVIGELAPKQIGLSNPEKVALLVAKPMFYFAKLGRPLIWILSRSTSLVLKILGIKKSDEPDVTEEEIQLLIEQGVYSGVVDKMEHEMVDQIFYMGDQRLGDILTPRTQLIWIDVESSYEENMELISTSYHSIFPVGKGSLDHFLGVIYTKKVFSRLLSEETFSIEDCIDETLVLPEHMKVLQALETLKETGHHEAVVIDEYGGIEGFVTLHDFIETIVGDMPLRDELTEVQITERDETTWLADGLVSVDTFVRFFELEDFPAIEDSNDYHTLGGFFTMYLGNIPKVGDTIIVENLKLEIIDMDHVRVDKVMITKQPKETDKTS